MSSDVVCKVCPPARFHWYTFNCFSRY